MGSLRVFPLLFCRLRRRGERGGRGRREPGKPRKIERGEGRERKKALLSEVDAVDPVEVHAGLEQSLAKEKGSKWSAKQTRENERNEAS